MSHFAAFHLGLHHFSKYVFMVCLIKEGIIFILNCYALTKYNLYLFVSFVALRPKSTAMVMAGRSVHLTTKFPGQA